MTFSASAARDQDATAIARRKFSLIEKRLADPRLSSTAKTAFVALLAVLDDRTKTFTTSSYAKIGTAIGVGRRSAMRAMEELIEFGFVNRRTHNRSSNDWSVVGLFDGVAVPNPMTWASLNRQSGVTPDASASAKLGTRLGRDIKKSSSLSAGSSAKSDTTSSAKFDTSSGVKVDTEYTQSSLSDLKSPPSPPKGSDDLQADRRFSRGASLEGLDMTEPDWEQIAMEGGTASVAANVVELRPVPSGWTITDGFRHREGPNGVRIKKVAQELALDDEIFTRVHRDFCSLHTTKGTRSEDWISLFREYADGWRDRRAG